MVLVCILVLPLLGAGVIAAGGGRPSFGWAGVGANGAALSLGVWTAVRVVRTGALTGAQGVLRADALSAFMVVVIGVIALLASWIGIRTGAAGNGSIAWGVGRLRVLPSDAAGPLVLRPCHAREGEGHRSHDRCNPHAAEVRHCCRSPRTGNPPPRLDYKEPEGRAKPARKAS